MTDLATRPIYTPEQIKTAMQASGLIRGGTGGSQYNRVKISGQSFMIDDEPMPYNPKTDKPAFRAQIVDDITEYYAKFFADIPAPDQERTLARAIGRPEISGKMCKTYDADKPNAHRKAEDGTACVTCPVNPGIAFEDLPPEAAGQRCKWSGDLDFRLINAETGELDSEEVYTLNMSSTGVIEWQGSYKDQERGYVSERNFKNKLALLAIETYPDIPLTAAIDIANTALRLGGVIADFRILPAENKGAGFKWMVPSITPVQILEVGQGAIAIDTAEDKPAAPATADEGSTDDGTLPF